MCHSDLASHSERIHIDVLTDEAEPHSCSHRGSNTSTHQRPNTSLQNSTTIGAVTEDQ